jgi:hypothetical protein
VRHAAQSLDKAFFLLYSVLSDVGSCQDLRVIFWDSIFLSFCGIFKLGLRVGVVCMNGLWLKR